MRRIHVDLDDGLWDVLHARAKREKKTVSQLVRQAVGERYLGGFDQRRMAMQSFVGSRRAASPILGATEEVCSVRGGRRLDTLGT